jgi:hypothetical protein
MEKPPSPPDDLPCHQHEQHKNHHSEYPMESYNLHYPLSSKGLDEQNKLRKQQHYRMGISCNRGHPQHGASH